MFDSALAFERYRLEVVRNWPDSAAKEKVLASIEYSLGRNGPSRRLVDSREFGQIGDRGRRDGQSGSTIGIIDGPHSPAPS